MGNFLIDTAAFLSTAVVTVNERDLKMGENTEREREKGRDFGFKPLLESHRESRHCRR